jgi:hypothetical protein
MIPKYKMSAPTPTVQLLKYADEVDVNVAPQDVNLVDLESYGHRVSISVATSAMNGALSWVRAANSARPVGHFSDASGAFVAALAAAMNASYTDTDAVTDKLTFDSSALNLNSDARIREGGQVSANDLLMAYVLYKVYGSTTAPTEDVIFNLQDAYGMLSSADYAAAIVAAFNNSESQVDASGNEKGAVDAMFRDLLSADPLRFFDASGNQVAGLFEVNTDASGSGTWNLVEGDKIEVRTVFTFQHAVTLRTTLDVAQNLTPLPSQANDETIYIPENSKLSIRLQITASDSATGGGPPAGAPGVPTNLSMTPLNARAQLTWSAPASSGDSSITGYNIYKDGTLYASGVPLPAGKNQQFIEGLVYGNTHSVSVTAVNANGESSIGSPISVYCSGSPAGVPTNFTVTFTSPNQVDVTWAEPTFTGGSSILQYQVFIDGINEYVCPADDFPSGTGFQIGSGTFVFTVLAFNSSGPGPQTAPITLVVP